MLEIPADRETLDPLLIQAAEMLRDIFEVPTLLGRWDQRRLCVLAPEAALDRAAGQLTRAGLRLSITSLEEIPDGDPLPLRAEIAMLAD